MLNELVNAPAVNTATNELQEQKTVVNSDVNTAVNTTVNKTEPVNKELKADYNAGIDDFLKELQLPVEEFKEENPLLSEEINNITPEKKEELRQKTSRSARFITRQIDRGAAWLACEIALNPEMDSKAFHADDEDLKEIQSYWEEILKEKGGNIPPWLMLCITYLLIYGPTYRNAFKARAINKAMAKKAAEKEAEIEILKAKLAEEQAKSNAPHNNETKNNTDGSMPAAGSDELLKKQLVDKILELRHSGEGMSLRQISAKLNVPYSFVQRTCAKVGQLS